MLSQKKETETSSGAGVTSYGYEQKRTFDVNDPRLHLNLHSAPITSNTSGTSVLGAATTKASQPSVSVTVNVGLSADRRLIREANKILSGDNQKTTLASS